MQGLKGEYICDDRAWIIKAHHPGNIPMNLPFTSNKVITCVRSPFDVIQSFACFSNTMNHSIKPEIDFEKDYPEWWDWYVREIVDNMKLYFDTLIKDCVEDKKNPIYFVRYEDMVVNMKDHTTGALEFLLDLPELAGTNAERMLDSMVAKGPGATQTYKVKETTGVPNAHGHRYTESQIDYIKQELGHILYFFGYTNHPTEENNFDFFKFNEHKQANLD